MFDFCLAVEDYRRVAPGEAVLAFGFIELFKRYVRPKNALPQLSQTTRRTIVEEMEKNGGRPSPHAYDQAQRDVLRAGAPGREVRSSPTSRSLADVMSTPVHAVDPEAGVRQTALRLQELKIGCLAVMRGDALEGIVTDSDFVGVAINLLEQLEAVEPLEQE